MDWPVDLIPYRCDFYLQNRTSVFRSPVTGTRQVLRLQGERWMCTASWRFAALSDEERRRAQNMDAQLAKMRGMRETVNIWDFARPQPLGPNLDLSSIGLSYFYTVGSPGGITQFVDGGSPTVLTAFSGGGSGVTVYGGWPIGAEQVLAYGFPQNTTQLYAGDYVELGGFLYMLEEDATADGLNRAYLYLNRPLVAALSHGDAVITSYASTPMQLVDDDQPNRSVDTDRVYEYTASFVEAFF